MRIDIEMSSDGTLAVELLMTIDMLKLGFILALVPAIAFAQPAPPTPPPPPPPPTDAPAGACVPGCRDGFTCLDGACVSACNPACSPGEVCTGSTTGVCKRSEPAQPLAAATPAVAPQPAATTTAALPPPFAPAAPPRIDNFGSFHANLIGFLGLGPTVSIEFGGRTTFAARLRSMNLGALSYVVLMDPARDELGFSYGFAGSLRHYMGRGGNMRGFFLSETVEYISTHIEEAHSVAYDTQSIVPQFEVGYRWVWGTFLLDVGGGLGYAIIIDKSSKLINRDGTLYPNNAQNQIYPGANVAIGWMFR